LERGLKTRWGGERRFSKGAFKGRKPLSCNLEIKGGGKGGQGFVLKYVGRPPRGGKKWYWSAPRKGDAKMKNFVKRETLRSGQRKGGGGLIEEARGGKSRKRGSGGGLRRRGLRMLRLGTRLDKTFKGRGERKGS